MNPNDYPETGWSVAILTPDERWETLGTNLTYDDAEETFWTHEDEVAAGRQILIVPPGLTPDHVWENIDDYQID